METAIISRSLALLFSELVNGANNPRGNFMLNTGDVGLLKSLDRLSAAEASRSADGGATIAAHAQHLRYGLSLMNRWAREGGNPFADATWDAAWKTSVVDATQWDEIRAALGDEVRAWEAALGTPREPSLVELSGMAGSIAHLAYHLGAIRQIARASRGPREGSFPAAGP